MKSLTRRRFAFGAKRSVPFSLTRLVLVCGACFCLLSAHAAGAPLRGESVTTYQHSSLKPDWDYDGKQVFGHLGNDVCLWNASNGRLIWRLKGHEEQITSVQLSPKRDFALSASSDDFHGDLPRRSPFKDTSVRVWDLRNGKEILKLVGERKGALSPDGRQILTLRWAQNRNEAIATTEEISSGRKIVEVHLPKEAYPVTYWRIRFSPDGTQFCVDATREAFLYDSKSGSQIGRHRFAINSYTLNGDGCGFLRSHDVAGFFDGQGKSEVWNFKTNKSTPDEGLLTESEFPTESSKRAPWKVTVAPDLKRLAIEWATDGQPSMTTSLYETAPFREIATIGNLGFSPLIGFSTDEKTMLFGGAAFCVYSAATGELVRKINLEGIVASDRWSPYN
jgi:WD40 repeat protein